MKSQSFADILGDLLEEDGPEPTPVGAAINASFEPTPLLSWNGPAFKSVNGKAYPKTERPVGVKLKAAQAPPLKTVIEPIIGLTHLTTLDRVLVERMIQWGGTELASGLSASALKKAHRRLVKRLHPDLGASRTQSNHDLFLEVQSAYETLSRALPGYISESASGSESASAAGSQRPNAA